MAVGVAGACVGEADGAERAFELSCLAGELPTVATFAGNEFDGLSDKIVVFAGAAILT